MPNRTRVVCLHEGEKGRSIDPVFIMAVLKGLDPPWIRPWNGNNTIRAVDCGSRSSLIRRFPTELKTCLSIGSSTTMMVWADLDDDVADGDELKRRFRQSAKTEGITDEQFDGVVFILAKDRLENWIEYLNTGTTSEAREGPRVKDSIEAKEAAAKLVEHCKSNSALDGMPPSLRWSCLQWRRLLERMG